MKKINVIVILAAAFAWFTMMSNSGGRAATGSGASNAPGDNGSCANTACHSAGAFDPSVSMTLKDSNGVDALEYFPGETYSIEVTVTAASGTPSAYGFQLLALDDNGESLDNWSNLSANVQESLLGNRKYIEQNAASALNTFTMDWTPAADKTSDVQFYLAANAVNGNGSPGGDGTALMEMTLPRAVLSNKNVAAQINLNLSPNPVNNYLTIESDRSFVSGSLLNLEGREILKINSNSLNVSFLSKGMYLIRLRLEDGTQAVKKIIKN